MNFDSFSFSSIIPVFDNEFFPYSELNPLDKFQDEISQNFDLDLGILTLFGKENEVNIEKTTNNTILNKKLENNFKVPLSLKFYLFDEINEFIKKMNLSKEIEKKVLLNKEKNSEEIEMILAELTNTIKRRRNKGKNKGYFIKIKEELKLDKPLLGRKRKGDNTKRKRNKYDPYNIMKKIKNKIIHYLLLFINNLIESFYTEEEINKILLELNLPRTKSKHSIQVIKKIKHDIYSKKTKRDENLKFLSLTIAEYLSNIISKKYIYGLHNSNKLIINRLLQDETKKDIFDFIFNKLNLEEWTNISLSKTGII